MTPPLTSQSPNVQHVSNDVAADVLVWGVPGQVQGAGAERCGPETSGGLGQVGSLADGEPGAGLVGAGTVLSDALINGLILRSDAGDGEGPGGQKGRCWYSFSRTWTFTQTLLGLLRVSTRQLDVATRIQQFAVF